MDDLDGLLNSLRTRIQEMQLRQANEDYGDMDFYADVSPYLDPIARAGFDPKRGRLMDDNPFKYSVKGIYTPAVPEGYTKERYMESMRNQDLGNIAETYGRGVVPDMVYLQNDMTGDILNQNQTWAHEYRHRGIDQVSPDFEGDFPGAIEEQFNRWMDDGADPAKNGMFGEILLELLTRLQNK